MSGFPVRRPRRLRQNENLRAMIRETEINVRDLIYPFFVIHGQGIKNPVPSMPGVYQLSIDNLVKEAAEVVTAGIPAVLLFGIPAVKDEVASGAYDPRGIVQEAVRALKGAYPELLIITDVCLCEYTSHGHCGLVDDGRVLNDPTLELIARTALSHVEAGADIVAPSDMMDGRVGTIRRLLDKEGFTHTPILAYAAKYASAFYGPFREAAASAPQFGDRRSYQMDPANSDEALREVELDLQEGADMIMVKPALPYLDIIRRVKDTFNAPLVAYQVSGEYAMLKAAAASGWLDEEKTVLESLTAIKRAGADLIITYYALDAARWLK
ncbi:porphobilinogen synthase [Moorella sulfitireducens (nom. illeg.)]|uniref:porphobilinogen synthase n=1 Tax=Neomoorella sulfitireducens TaxID=2972948 RepID=UPI0021AC7AF6|nr:porphobilinogen synthase [Moorella sulfitireducens]